MTQAIKKWRLEHFSILNTSTEFKKHIFLPQICTVFAKICFKAPEIVILSTIDTAITMNL